LSIDCVFKVLTCEVPKTFTDLHLDGFTHRLKWLDPPFEVVETSGSMYLSSRQGKFSCHGGPKKKKTRVQPIQRLVFINQKKEDFFWENPSHIINL
jgi:hypothetical protein